MKNKDIHKVVGILKEKTFIWKNPASKEIAEVTRDPFRVLISCLISSRTKDATTTKATEGLFTLGSSAQELALLSVDDIEKAIYPAGFYRVKARMIKEVCHTLREKYQGKVPRELEELLKLKGVGRKTANLVITLGFNKPGICVDTHVHRISNRLGYVKTNNPSETERALREKLPKDYWIIFNSLIVPLGQNICTPISPKCSICPVEPYCDKVAVTKHR
jgi:endonuclease-3